MAAASISDHALIGDMQSAALVCRDATIDWLCWPRFDSDACFASLLGNDEHGAWRLAPGERIERARRRYVPDTLVLETELTTASGTVRIIDFMPERGRDPDLVRIVEGVHGDVPMHMELAPRFGYGDRRPWIQYLDEHIQMTSAPDNLTLWPSVKVGERSGTLYAEFRVRPGQRETFVLAWHAAHEAPPQRRDPMNQLDVTIDRWRTWIGQSTYEGPWGAQVRRSLITLKALTYAPTGGIVAAPTTSLPERIGGVRNWDYRYCWLRDATLTLYALVDCGFITEADAFGQWIERTARAEPSRLQVLYGVAGERRLTELELPWLPGYRNSAPVRIGNAGAEQFQLDIYGELIDCLHHSRRHGLSVDPDVWDVQRAVLDHLKRVFDEPDDGIWEVRGPRRHFTHSKVMTWVAFDRMIKDASYFGLDGPIEAWREMRDRIHREVCERAFDPRRGAFVQAYNRPELDASALLIPIVGFLPPDDPRVRSTIAAIRDELSCGGFIRRYDTARTDDGLPPGEGLFLPCSFWLVDNLCMSGEHDEALELFERLLGCCNDLGLLAEEIDPATGGQLGNFPQAFSHVALIDSAVNLTSAHGPAQERSHM